MIVCLLFLEDLFLNTAGAVIDCNKGNASFHVNAQPSNDNDVEVEPVVDLDNP